MNPQHIDMEIESKEKRRKSKPRVFLRILVILLAICLLVGAILFYSLYSKLNVIKFDGIIGELLDFSGEGVQDSGGTPVNADSIDPSWDYSDKDVKNILLIGVDNDYLPGMDDLGNADGLVIVSINRRTKQIVMTSLMRDILVSVGNQYKTKITLAYHYGGTEVLIDTIESNFGIPINNYVLMNYFNVIDIVDAMGGITLDVTADELYWMADKIHNLNELKGRDYDEGVLPPEQAGSVHMDGIQTAAYLRIRYAGNNDFERTERLRRVLMQLKEKALDMKLNELFELADTVLPCIETNFGQQDLLSLAVTSPRILRYSTVSNRIPVDGSYYFDDFGGSVVVIDYKINNRFLYYTVYKGCEP